VEPAPRNAIILGRLSDLRDDDERGVEGQVQDGHDYAPRIGWHIGPQLSHVVIENNKTESGSGRIGVQAAEDHAAGRPGRAVRPGFIANADRDRVAASAPAREPTIWTVWRPTAPLPPLAQKRVFWVVARGEDAWVSACRTGLSSAQVMKDIPDHPEAPLNGGLQLAWRIPEFCHAVDEHLDVAAGQADERRSRIAESIAAHGRLSVTEERSSAGQAIKRSSLWTQRHDPAFGLARHGAHRLPIRPVSGF